MKNPGMKDFSNEIAVITDIENFKSKKVVVSNTKGKAHLTKSIGEFELWFKGVFPYPKDKTLEVKIDGVPYKLESRYFDGPVNEELAKIPCENTFEIDYMSKGNIKSGQNFRMFFFDDSKRNSLFHHKLESPKHDGILTWTFESARIEISKKRYDISQYKFEGKSYIVIENHDPVNYDDFTADSYAIQKGVGFLIGYMPGGENYIFSGNDFIYQRLSRKSLKSIYYPVTSNPYSFEIMHKKPDLADNYSGVLKPIPALVASDFVSKIRENENLSVAIIFLMEVAHMKSVVSMPGVFSVILESFSNIIISEYKIRKTLIEDKDMAAQLVKDLNAVIDSYSDKIHPDAELKIRRRLVAINQPVNPKKITNAMKLREPFDQLNIALSPLDEAALEYRNDLLHGNIMMHDGTLRTSAEIDDHMLYVSAKLYTLISKLVLKNSGYQGYVINHSKFYDYAQAVGESDYFEKI